MAVFKTEGNSPRYHPRMMNRIGPAAALAAAIVAGFTEPAGSTTVQQAIASRAYLIGNWSCTFTVGDEAGSYRTTWSAALNGVWLKQTIDQPAQPRAEAFTAEYLVGYDERRGQWVRFGAMTTGQYFVIRMTDTPDGWGWTYVRLFGNARPPSQQFDTTFSRTSDTSYRIDGPTYPDAKGTLVTEHHECRKIG
jgi:hypothetical protein